MILCKGREVWLSCLVMAWLFLASCTATHPPPVAEEPEPEPAPQVTAGAVILREFCSTCHLTPDPAAKPPSEWYRVVMKMQQLAKDARRDTLSQKELFALTDYLEACATQDCESPQN